MPKVYAPCHTLPERKHATYFQVFTGAKTMLDGSRGARLIDVCDGTANTALVVEAGWGVEWTKPDNIRFDIEKMPSMGGENYGGFQVLLADGSVRFVRNPVDDEQMRRLILINDDQQVDFDKLRTGK